VIVYNILCKRREGGSPREIIKIISRREEDGIE